LNLFKIQQAILFQN